MVYLPGTRLGAFRAYFFGFFICTSGFLFGYDTGIVGMFPPTPAPNSLIHANKPLQAASSPSNPTKMTSATPTKQPSAP
jgi:hypothetical protein